MNGLGRRGHSIRYTRYFGTYPRPKKDAWMLIGQDGGQSIDLGTHTLFVFSDTLVLPLPHQGRGRLPHTPFHLPVAEPCLFLGNSAALTQSRDLRRALAKMRYYTDEGGFPREILQPTPEECATNIRFWPEHGIFLNGKVYLYYLGIEQLEPGSMWRFRNLGVGLAVLEPDTGTCERILRTGDWRLWSLNADDFHFGVQVAQEADKVYVFGSLRTGFTVQGILGRVKADQITEPSAYTYLQVSSGAWVTDLAEAGTLGDCGSDYSVSYNPYLGQYLLIYIDSFSKTLFMRLAERITGPYSGPQAIGRVPYRPASDLVYVGFEHPKFAAEGGKRIYVSYCQPYFTPNSLLEVCFQ